MITAGKGSGCLHPDEENRRKMMTAGKGSGCLHPDEENRRDLQSWWLGVVAWLDLHPRSCHSARSLRWDRDDAIWMGSFRSDLSTNPTRGRTWWQLRREDNDYKRRRVIQRIWRDGEGKAWLAAVVGSIPWFRVSAWA
ncbi:hypothetical protein ACLB2K_073014 [Fragaria x ananassa]